VLTSLNMDALGGAPDHLTDAALGDYATGQGVPKAPAAWLGLHSPPTK
jgi:hypothetical protein